MSVSYTAEDRFSMSAERYLTKHNILVYLEDSITQLLDHRDENPKLNCTKFLSEYFNSLRDGNHTMFREYHFIQSTPHNRASFVRLFWKCYRQIGKKGDLLSIQEYHSLVTLLCADFPFQTIQKTANIILLDDALDCLISFTDFIYAFQVQFYYEEFLEKCLDIYHQLQQTQHSPRNPVVVPSASDDPKVHVNSHHPGDGVDAMQFFRSIYQLCDRMPYSTPPAEALKEILFNVQRVSFYGFLMAIAKSESINEHIGRLPPKSELLEGTDTELTSVSVSEDNSADPSPQATPHSQSNIGPAIKNNLTGKSPVIRSNTNPATTTTTSNTRGAKSRPASENTNHPGETVPRSSSTPATKTSHHPGSRPMSAAKRSNILKTFARATKRRESTDSSDDSSDDDSDTN